MSDIGKPCYKHNDGNPCYKKGGTQPIYKVSVGDWTQISFAWGSDGRDLDICAYWDGAPSMQMGYGYDTSTTEKVSGAYRILYSGDIRGEDSSEWCKIKMKPWSGGVRTFKIHFNYYGYDSSHTANTCTVIASQIGGGTKVKRGQPCSTTAGRAAIGGSGPDADPYCVVSFDETGKLIGIS